MKLRRPCQHGRYEPHRISHGRATVPIEWTDSDCPGGVFLPDDTLTDAAWQFNEAVSLLRECRSFSMVPGLTAEIDEALPAIQSALEALALSVREADLKGDLHGRD